MPRDERARLFDLCDERRAALSALARSARYAAALDGVPDADRDALLAVAGWADRHIVAAHAQQAELLAAAGLDVTG